MKKWIQSLLYIPMHTKPTDENILRLLMPSIVGVILCMACLAGTSWAWFSAGIQTPPQTIAAANYDIEVVVVNDKDGTPVNQEKGGVCAAGGELLHGLTDRQRDRSKRRILCGEGRRHASRHHPAEAGRFKKD